MQWLLGGGGTATAEIIPLLSFHKLVTLCTCEKRTLNPMHRRGRCENPNLGDAGSVTAVVTSFKAKLLCFKGLLLSSTNTGQKLSSVLSLLVQIDLEIPLLFLMYCLSEQTGAGTYPTLGGDVGVWILSKRKCQSVHTTVLPQQTAV